MLGEGCTAFSAVRIYDGEVWHRDACLLVVGGSVQGIGALPADCALVELGDARIVPGFIDLQVNGGGGHLVGDYTSVEHLRLMCEVHAEFGVTGLLPTLVTSADRTVDSVLAAGAMATRLGVPGLLGLHLEGPHLSLARKGAHDPALLRAMTEADIVRLERARQSLPNLLVTIAAETVPPETTARLVRAGIVVSIGHSDATYDVAMAAFRAGASMATHLFNAMSQLGNRDPGVVGAVLDSPHVYAGTIADGFHVHPMTARLAFKTKRGEGRLFLVSDSMHQAGTDLTELEWGDRMIYRRNGALRLADGTLAGADLTMSEAVRRAPELFDILEETAFAMASAYPARALGLSDAAGNLKSGSNADFAVLDRSGHVVASATRGQLRCHDRSHFKGGVSTCDEAMAP